MTATITMARTVRASTKRTRWCDTLRRDQITNAISAPGAANAQARAQAIEAARAVDYRSVGECK
ncbi:hypothetical protein [Caballeronia sp. KNU42]